MSGFFRSYPTIDICRQHSEQYIVKASSGVEVIELWWNGLEWDLSFTDAYINQAFLEEASRLLKHLNNGVNCDFDKLGKNKLKKWLQ